MTQLPPLTFSKGTSLETILAALDEHGVLLMPDYLGAEEVAGLRDEFHRCFETREPWVSPLEYKAGRAVSVKFNGLDARFPLTRRTFSGDFMRACTDSYLGPKNLLNFVIFMTHDQPRPVPINPLHFDKIRTLKFFLYLKDTTADNGAFDAVPGSHKIAERLMHDHLRRGGRVKDIPNHTYPPELGAPVSIEGPAGTMIVFTTDVYHRGGVVSPGHERYVMRGHSRTDPPPVYEPKRYTAQWWRESAFNPMRYLTGGPPRPVLGAPIEMGAE